VLLWPTGVRGCSVSRGAWQSFVHSGGRLIGRFWGMLGSAFLGSTGCGSDVGWFGGTNVFLSLWGMSYWNQCPGRNLS
jgi:hypothetical protein